MGWLTLINHAKPIKNAKSRISIPVPGQHILCAFPNVPL